MTPEQLAKLGDIATLEHSDLLVLERDEWDMVLEHIDTLERELAEARELLKTCTVLDLPYDLENAICAFLGESGGSK